MNLKPIEELDLIKRKYFSGELTYDQAKRIAIPIIEIINKKSKEIAKKYKQKPKLISFAGFMR